MNQNSLNCTSFPEVKTLHGFYANPYKRIIIRCECECAIKTKTICTCLWCSVISFIFYNFTRIFPDYILCFCSKALVCDAIVYQWPLYIVYVTNQITRGSFRRDKRIRKEAVLNCEVGNEQGEVFYAYMKAYIHALNSLGEKILATYCQSIPKRFSRCTQHLKRSRKYTIVVLMSLATSLNIHFKFGSTDNTQSEPHPQQHAGLFTAIHNLLWNAPFMEKIECNAS